MTFFLAKMLWVLRGVAAGADMMTCMNCSDDSSEPASMLQTTAKRLKLTREDADDSGFTVTAFPDENVNVIATLPKSYTLGGTIGDCLQAMESEAKLDDEARMAMTIGCKLLSNSNAPVGLGPASFSMTKGGYLSFQLAPVTSMFNDDITTTIGKMIQDQCVTVAWHGNGASMDNIISQYDSNSSYSSSMQKDFGIDTSVGVSFGRQSSTTQFQMDQGESSVQTGSYSSSTGQWSFQYKRGTIRNSCIQACSNDDSTDGCILKYVQPDYVKRWRDLADVAMKLGYITAHNQSHFAELKALALESSGLWLKSYWLGASSGFLNTATIYTTTEDTMSSMSMAMGESLSAGVMGVDVETTMKSTYTSSFSSSSSSTDTTYTSEQWFMGPDDCAGSSSIFLNFSSTDMQMFMKNCTTESVMSIADEMTSMSILFNGSVSTSSLIMSLAGATQYDFLNHGDWCGVMNALQYRGRSNWERGHGTQLDRMARSSGQDGNAWETHNPGWWTCGDWACFSNAEMPANPDADYRLCYYPVWGGICEEAFGEGFQGAQDEKCTSDCGNRGSGWDVHMPGWWTCVSQTSCYNPTTGVCSSAVSFQLATMTS